MLTAFSASLVLGLAAIAARYYTDGLRVAVIAPEGVVDPASEFLGTSVLSPSEDLRFYDVVLLPMQGALSPLWSASLSRAMLSGSQVRHVAEYLEEARGQTSIDYFHLDHVSERSGAGYTIGKRFIDLALILFFSPVIALLLAVGIFAVILTMGRPVFFTQPRVGLGGRPFSIYKLRTMRAATAVDIPTATQSSDGRITLVGRFLRRYRVDELPQAWNVVCGEMSLIGPRPEWTLLAEKYVADLPAYPYRHLVRPGITGWAQVRAGYAANLDETRVKLSYDLYYVKNLSLALDLQIMLRTLWTLLMGSGAR